MKTILYIILSSLAILTAAPAQQPAAEWTLMIFLNADNNLEPYGMKDFEEMARVDDSEKVNILVQMDRTPGYAQEPGAWTQTLRFKMRKNLTATPMNALDDLGEVNMGSGQSLRDFVEWAVHEYPAKRYALVIWDHGQGWRFQQAVSVRSQLPPKEKGRADMWIKGRADRLAVLSATSRFNAEGAPTADQVLPGTVRYISSDDSSSDHLYNREIQNTLETSLPALLAGGKLDLIGFDACLMQMVETGFALRKSAHVMVGSEELEPGNGWNYTKVLGGLVAAPEMDAETLGRHIVEAYRQTYENSDVDTTLSAVRLGKLEDLAQATSALGEHCRTIVATHPVPFVAARGICEVFAPGLGLNGIDLDHYCEKLDSSPGLPSTVKPLILSVRQSITTAIIANYAGIGRDDATAFGARGIAIYFPRTHTDFLADPDREGYEQGNPHYPIEFVQSANWDEFLHAFWTIAP